MSVFWKKLNTPALMPSLNLKTELSAIMSYPPDIEISCICVEALYRSMTVFLISM